MQRYWEKHWGLLVTDMFFTSMLLNLYNWNIFMSSSVAIASSCFWVKYVVLEIFPMLGTPTLNPACPVGKVMCLAHLAFMPMSLYNHEFSVVCCKAINITMGNSIINFWFNINGFLTKYVVIWKQFLYLGNTSLICADFWSFHAIQTELRG